MKVMKKAFLTRKLFDGQNNGYKQDVAILVEDNIIQEIVGKNEVPGEYVQEDLGDQFVIPGLFDSHVHLVWTGSPDPNQIMLRESSEMTAIRAAEHARLSLLHGITTVRDVGGDAKIVLGVRDAIQDSVIRGSRVIASGNPIMMTGGHVHEIGLEVDGPHEARKGVRKLLKEGVDLIKLMASGGVYGKSELPGQPQMTVEEMKVVVEEAHLAGRKVAAHAEGLQGILNALEAGVDTIEHGNLMTPEIAKFMAEKQVFVVPTMAPFYLSAHYGVEKGYPDYHIRKSKSVLAGSYNVIRYIKEYGVPVAAGTDCGGPNKPHGALAFELELMVDGGLTPFEALLSATAHASIACGVEKELGTIEPGKIADFIGLKNDPLKNISALREVDTVVKEGRFEKRHGVGCENVNDLSSLRLKNNAKNYALL